MSKDKLTIGAILFPEYDLLDVNGPLRMFGALENVNILMISQHGDKIKSGSKIGNYTEYNFGNCPEFDILFVPGGMGTRKEVNNPVLLEFIKNQIPKVKYVLIVCTGAGLVAKTGLLDGKKATTNKLAWQWVTSQVSAGMDMALGFISDVYGRKVANDVALKTEYDWHTDPNWDPFGEKI
ncbi:unnamed protein product [Rhizophagus irregularis]|nr:unnamed protein product [Rhizophagus irregularis]